MKTNDFTFAVVNSGELDDFIHKHLINARAVITVMIAEDEWVDNKGRFCYNYSDRIIVTPISNLKYGWASDTTELLKYQQLHERYSVGIQRSILRQIRSF